ncbi:unnamed protein product [Caenorhabditis auriculariae]|uniref:DUF7808 domain-containing protein n=1 Tax=Caenorhabditis auriculariae TaxID=2777116 RepID=A0A8S1HI50_9PELO|nr:unnamed protein product [Caenorhabditis auriculariae]
MISNFPLCLLLLPTFVTSESVHWQWRLMTCEEPKEGAAVEKKGASPCRIGFMETEKDPSPRTAPFDSCFEEDFNGKLGNYCNIMCPGADTAYLIKRSPSNHRSCFGHFTYKLEKRGNNFFMWRNGKCRTSSVQFLVRYFNYRERETCKDGCALKNGEVLLVDEANIDSETFYIFARNKHCEELRLICYNYRTCRINCNMVSPEILPYDSIRMDEDEPAFNPCIEMIGKCNGIPMKALAEPILIQNVFLFM